jgi:pyrroloquinoline quinone biosynthesis protein D
MLVLDEIAQLVVSRLAGQPVGELIAALAAEFDAPVEVIGQDVLGLLTTLADKGFLRDG